MEARGAFPAMSMAGLVVLLLVSCTSAAQRATSSSASPTVAGQSATSSSLSMGTPSPSLGAEQIVYFTDVQSAGLVLVAVGAGPAGGRAPRLLATSVDGRDFRDIGPRTRAGDYPDSVFFLDRAHGWFTTYSGGGGSETLYRTQDGGRIWQSFPVTGHVLAAGSTDAIQFVSDRDGWLVVVEPTGPAERLYRSRDGGQSWHRVADLRHGSRDTAGLPRLGLVKFEPGNRIGWLGGGPDYIGPLYLTRDQGRNWQPAGIPSQPAARFGLPAIFGDTVLEPVTRCSGLATELRLYVSIDNGGHWSSTPAAGIARGGRTAYSDDCNQVSTAFPSAAVGWATAVSQGHVIVVRTTDQAQHWRTVTAPHPASRYTPSIGATDSTHAWLQVDGVDGYGNRVYVTNDGGHSWHRIDQLAIR